MDARRSRGRRMPARSVDRLSSENVLAVYSLLQPGARRIVGLPRCFSPPFLLQHVGSCLGLPDQPLETSKSRIMQFVPTRPPASRQMRAAALSSANPLLPKTPALAHAARRWPNESIGRPHSCRCVNAEATASGGDARGQPGRDGEGSASRNQWEQLTKQCQLRDLLGACLARIRQAHGLLDGRGQSFHEGGSKPMVPARDRMALAAAPREEPLRNTLQLPNKVVCDLAVSGMDHRECVRPTGPESETLDLAVLRKPNPPNDNGSEPESEVSSLWTGST